MKKLLNAALLCALICIVTINPAFAAAKNTQTEKIAEETAQHLYNTVKNPQIGSIGGEWAVIGLSRSGCDIPEDYYKKYIDNAKKYIEDCGGMLHERKYTEYSRVILALTALGQNPHDIGGYDVISPLGDYEKTVWQGINGAVFALIALDSGNYDMPACDTAKTQANREMYIDYILNGQNENGSFSLDNDSEPDVDITAMALQALSGYTDKEKVKKAIAAAVDYLSSVQNDDGGFESMGSKNSESCSQVVIAMSLLEMPADSEKLVKNGNSVMDKLLSYYDGKGGFMHIADDETNLMATEQALCALDAYNRFCGEKNSLYNMSDCLNISENKPQISENTDGMTVDFSDISDSPYKNEIKKLASDGIINGKGENLFEPQSTMTRAEFAAITVRAVGLTMKKVRIFDDVNENDWYFEYVGTAYKNGIVNGVSEKEFNPQGTITREEAAAMMVRAAKLCGADTDISGEAVRDALAQFDDYREISDWAAESAAVCCMKNILPQNGMEFKPSEYVSRGEIAYMIYGMMQLSERS